MSRKMLIIVLLCTGIFLGCSTTGRQYDVTAIDNIELWKTTKSEVIALAGEPVSQNRGNNGIDTFYYVYGECYPLGFGRSMDTMEVQFYNDIVIKKSQLLSKY